MFEWNDKYSVHISSIDGQHRNLFRIGEDLYRAMSSGKGKAHAGEILERLMRYTEVHFAHEERLLQSHDYPDFEAHKAKHDALMKQVARFQNDFENGRTELTIQLLQFLRKWLQNHIQDEDQKYAGYLRTKAVA